MYPLFYFLISINNFSFIFLYKFQIIKSIIFETFIYLTKQDFQNALILALDYIIIESCLIF